MFCGHSGIDNLQSRELVICLCDISDGGRRNDSINVWIVYTATTQDFLRINLS